MQRTTQLTSKKLALKRYSVLIIDEAAENRIAIQEAIQSPIHLVDTAATGQEAIELHRQNSYSLILLDTDISDIEGFALAEILLAEDPNTALDIIYMTTEIKDDHFVQKCLTAGGIDCFIKPLDLDLLRLRIKNHSIQQTRIEELKQSHEKLQVLSKELDKQTQSHIHSVEYAKLIQERILPDINRLEDKFKNSFIIYQPKDIIGGDFYMMFESNSRTIMVCADCTGHGVPGAMLSMVGYGFLKGIIMEERIFDPGEILTALNRKIRHFFGKDANVGTHGMDVAICVYRNDIFKLEYATAKRPFILRDQMKLIELKGDMISIGDEVSQDYVFQTFEYPASRDFWVYLFTDGVTDQFGGPKQKKLGRKKLKGLLLETNYNSTQNQKEILTEQLDAWKGSNSQTDDLTIMGNYFY